MIWIGFAVSLLASTAGAISGVGGGVVIKPVLDMIGFADASTVSFLSSATVITMAAVTLARTRKSKVKLDIGVSAWLAAGSALGGVGGKLLFDSLLNGAADQGTVKAVQAAVLLIMVVGIFIYILKKHNITPRKVSGIAVCLAAGIGLGATASFLGIGGGPINIIVFYYFFGMVPKTAAGNSIFVILCSQAASLAITLCGAAMPQFDAAVLITMMFGGVGGALIGSALFSKVSQKAVQGLYCCMMGAVAIICVINIVR